MYLPISYFYKISSITSIFTKKAVILESEPMYDGLWNKLTNKQKQNFSLYVNLLPWLFETVYIDVCLCWKDDNLCLIFIIHEERFWRPVSQGSDWSYTKANKTRLRAQADGQALLLLSFCVCFLGRGVSLTLIKECRKVFYTGVASSFIEKTQRLILARTLKSISFVWIEGSFLWLKAKLNIF